MTTLKIAIIEDEEAHFLLMERVIKKEFPHASVYHFDEAGTFLYKIDKIDCDLIIMDYIMPDMNGIELLETLKNNENQIPVIIISGQGNEVVAVKAMKLGARDYIVKSSNFVSLLPGLINKFVKECGLRESLRKNKERFRIIFELSPVGIQLYDSEGKLVNVNKACLDILGINDFKYLKGLDIFQNPFLSDEIIEKLKKGENIKSEISFSFENIKKQNHFKTYKSGTVHIDLSITKLGCGKEGYLSGYMVHIKDITERVLAEDQVKKLSQQLIKAQEMERQRLSCDLHDNLSQDLSSLKISLDTLCARNDEISAEIKFEALSLSKRLQGIIMNVRKMAYGLRPDGLDELGLKQTISRYCEEFSRNNSIKVDFFSAGMEGLRVDSSIRIVIYRLVQEGLNNIRKHAEAQNATVKLVASFPDIILRIEDNGKGFDARRLSGSFLNEKKMGLKSMEQRVASAQGIIHVESEPGHGTKILVEIPFKGEKDEG